jgi:Ni,Fe-hydrogenase III large subunit/NADH:ubiquinone oxidoreductase subunit C
MDYITINNNQRISFSSIPVISYEDFMETVVFSLMKEKHNHCVNYYGVPLNDRIRFVCCIADDAEHTIHVTSCEINPEKFLPSFSVHNLAFEKFEREIHENFGIKYTDHPWLKPVRYAAGRKNSNYKIENYPFYKIESEELHEVGVGPIHAGVIEPGHFRFICNGEQILHLEIQLGYQHRGIEKLFLEKKKLLQLVTLAESIAGDTVVGHTTAFSNLWESMCGYHAAPMLEYIRTLALEHERIAIHTGDLSALCTDIAYQLGSSVYGRMRTPVINYFQEWCGNRLGKSLIRPFYTNYPYTETLSKRWMEIFDAYLPHFIEMIEKLFDLPSALARFERTGVVSEENTAAIGAVGMAARMSNVNRDIRFSHPHGYYKIMTHEPVLMQSGDVMARAKLRHKEIIQSIETIKKMLSELPSSDGIKGEAKNPVPGSFVISLVEGWRGEICHCAITDENGNLIHYKVKDPSFHNWLMLALAVRNNEISDFPICNKSFDLSYCGHDL